MSFYYACSKKEKKNKLNLKSVLNLSLKKNHTFNKYDTVLTLQLLQRCLMPFRLLPLFSVQICSNNFNIITLKSIQNLSFFKANQELKKCNTYSCCTVALCFPGCSSLSQSLLSRLSFSLNLCCPERFLLPNRETERGEYVRRIFTPALMSQLREKCYVTSFLEHTVIRRSSGLICAARLSRSALFPHPFLTDLTVRWRNAVLYTLLRDFLVTEISD
ncbi:hypothetical protein PUN28_018248 [Cardiocondyla obscurior]|uniref:Uncharacterized protein n=1 Tax=Cardiocondyla obscurior TaxID=286306 RepID=A0AAW2EGJ1_9HYME